MGISLSQFRDYSKDAVNLNNNLRVGHFGKQLQEVLGQERNRFETRQVKTTPSQNRKVRSTLLKAMRNDLKSTFGGVFKSTRKNLNWAANELMKKMNNDAPVSRSGLSGASVRSMLAQYDDYKKELKQTLRSASHIFSGKELSLQYKQLQKATPAEVRGMRSLWTAQGSGNAAADGQMQLRKDIGSAVQKMLNPMTLSDSIGNAFTEDAPNLNFLKNNLQELKNLTESAILADPPEDLNSADGQAKMQNALRTAVNVLQKEQSPEDSYQMKLLDRLCDRLPDNDTTVKLKSSLKLGLLGGTAEDSIRTYKKATRMLLNTFCPELTYDANVDAWMDALAATDKARDLEHLALSLQILATEEEMYSEQNCKDARAAPIGKAIKVLSRAFSDKTCSAKHVQDVVDRIFSKSEGPELDAIARDLEWGAINPFPRGHEEVRATYSERLTNEYVKQLETWTQDGTKPVPEETIEKQITEVVKDTSRNYKFTINGKPLAGSGKAARQAGEAKPTAEAVSTLFDTAVENNLPENLSENQRELMKSHVKFAALLYVGQLFEQSLRAGEVLRTDFKNLADFPVPFSIPLLGLDGEATKAIDIIGQGDGSWKLHYTADVKPGAVIPIGYNEATKDTEVAYLDQNDQANKVSISIEIDIRVSLTEDGKAETHVSFPQPPTVTANLNMLTPEEHARL